MGPVHQMGVYPPGRRRGGVYIEILQCCQFDNIIPSNKNFGKLLISNGVSQSLSDIKQRHPLARRHRRKGVPQAVQGHPRQIIALDIPGKRQ